jgi:hypothetical protein
MAWHEDLAPDRSWASLWSAYVLCGICRGIRRPEENCPVCSDPPLGGEPTVYQLPGGGEIEVSRTFMGAEGRTEDYLYLEMLQREWERPAPEFERFKSRPAHERPSVRAALVLLFWGYFETRLERLLDAGMQVLPESIRNDLLERYSSIGVRLYRLYKLMFGKTYFDDLSELGFPSVAALLVDLHKRRNDFSHGNPQAIDEATVVALVDALKTEHEAWIAVYNKRATRVG